MTIQSTDIDIDLVDVDKPAKLNPNNEEVALLLDGLDRVGLLNPIDVRPLGNGRYQLVCGRRRLWCAKHRKWKSIPARIGDWPEKMVEFVACIENLHRQQLTPAQQVYQNQVLLKEFTRAFGDDPGKAAGGQARAATSRRAGGQFIAAPPTRPPSPPATTPDVAAGGPTTAPAETPAPPKSHRSLLQDVLGRSESAAGVDLRLAKAFTPEQLDVLGHRQATHGDLVKLAALDPEPRKEAVNLIAVGKDTDGAIKDVRITPPAPATRSDSDMETPEWLELYCGELRRKIQDPGAFNRDAALYKETRDHLKPLKKNTLENVSRARDGGYGPFSSLFGKILSLGHPATWYICGTCDGKNLDKPKCDDCKGVGFKLRHDYPKPPNGKAKKP